MAPSDKTVPMGPRWEAANPKYEPRDSTRDFPGARSMAREFKLPDIGEGVAEGEITKWLVKEGAPIKENDLMVEVMTDKVTVQIPSPVTGKVLKLLAKEGETVKVGTVIIVLGEEGESAPAAPTKATPAAPPHAPATPAPSPTTPATAPGGLVLATPAVRKLARELGVDIERARGTGPGGRITGEDVRGGAKAQAIP